jgi:hypothetical protein
MDDCDVTVRFSIWARDSSPRRSDRLLVHPVATDGTFLRLTWPEREAGHSFLSSAEVKKMWSCTYTFPCVLTARYLIQKINFPPTFIKVTLALSLLEVYRPKFYACFQV